MFVDLISNYGEIAMDHLSTFESSYIHLQTRAAQDSVMIYQCIMNSISKEAKDAITVWSNDYHINNIPSGNLLLREVIRESHIDTNATEASIRTKLSSLDAYMVSVDNDISKFNIYVQYQLSTLASRGKQSEDILINFFKGYLACSHKIFHHYTEKKLDSYEEGQDIIPGQLMHWAKNKYDIIREANLWTVPSAE